MTTESEPRRVTYPGHGGVTLVGDAWGDPGSPGAILLHGGGQTRHAWDGTAERLARDGFHAIALDLRGHGESDWAPDGDYRLEAFVADLRAVVSTLPVPPAVIGASLGGITALMAEGEDGGGVASAVVLVDVAPRMEPEAVERIVGFMSAHPDGFASLDEAADAVAAYQPHRRRPRDIAGLRKNLRLGPDGRWRWHWDPRFITGERRPGAARDPERLQRAAASLRVPVLLVRGLLSDMVSPDGVEEFRRLAPHAEVADVAGAAHMVAGDRNDAFTEAVVEFLAPSPTKRA